MAGTSGFISGQGTKILHAVICDKKNKENFFWGGFKVMKMGFPGSSVVKNPPANAGDMGSKSDPRRSHMRLGSSGTTIKPVLRAGELQLLSLWALEAML